jgi:predicted metal-binding protein
VNRRAITLTATEQEKTYGDQLALDDTVFTILDKDRDAVLPNGEVVTNVTINSATGADASTTSDVATYADEIEISGPVVGTDGTGDGFLESNYDISYVAGDLTVNRRAAQIIASAQEKDYGDVHDLGDTAFTVVDRDGGALPNGETVNTVTLVSENGIDESTNANAVLYADNISVTPTSTNDPTITGSANFNQENYTFSYDTGDLTVNRRAAQIIASAQEKDYGDVHDLGDTAFTVVDRDGGALPNGETLNTVTLVSENGIDGSTDADVGTYADNILVTPTSTNDPTITGSANFNQENYTFSYGTADLTVNRRAITLTANEQEKTYGDQLALDDTVFTTLDKDGDAVLPNGEVVTNVTIDSATGVDASTSSDVATYADEIVISGPVAGTDGTGDGFLESNYDITYVAGDLTVNRRAAQIIASAQEKDYGDVHDLGDTAFTVVDRDGGALPNGETVNTVTLVSENGIDESTNANAVLYADNISVTPTSTNDPTITGSANFNQENYTFSYDTGDLTVNRRAAQIIASAQEKDYGDVHDLGDTAFTVVDRDGGALPNGETLNTVTLVSENGIDGSTDADVGTYADNILVTPTSTNDPTITGSANFNQENYTFSYGTADLTVNRRAITLTANEQEKTYGDQLALDDTVFTTLDKDGDAVLPNGEVVTNVTIDSATGVDASTSSDVATYADEIVISGPVAGTDGTGDGFLESNYDITYVAGDLTVNRRAAQIIASAQEKDYGDVHDLGDTAFTVVDRDGGALPNGETVNTVTLVSENGIDASTTANAVLYADNISVTPTGTNDPTITGSANFNQENYTFSYDTGDLTVNRRAAQIIASAQEKDYGDVHDLGDTAFTVIDRDGGALPNSETVNTVTLVSKNGIDASTDANAVLYADNISVTPTSTSDQTIAGSANFNQENYTFSYGTGDLTINRRAITLTANEQEKTYGDQLALDDTVFTTLDKDGDAVLPNGEVVTNVTINSATGVDAATSSDVATYADEIVISGPVAGTDGTGDGFLESNYDITYVAGDLNVNRRAAQIIASAQEKDYGDVHDLGDTAFTVVDRDGGALPNGETVNTVTLVSENGIDASTTANAVLYADNISVTPTSTNDPTITGSANFNQENYTFSYGTGDLTVNRRAAQIIASAQEKDYGDVHDLGDTAFTVIDRDGGALPNGETVKTVTLVSGNGIDASTDADAILYADNISVTPTSTNDPTITGSANFNQENYNFSYGTGDLTVNRRAITLTANEQEKTYGDQLALDDTVFTTLDKDGDAVLPNGEVVTNVTINSATGVDASTTSDVATYADEIEISGPVAGTDGTGDGFLESNYDISYVAGDLTVNRRAAQIIASAQEKDYGDVHDLGDTAFTVVDRDGGALPNGETVNTVTLVSENGIDESTNANAVLYADNISVTPTSTNDPTITGSANFNQENYTFSYDTGDLTVNRRAAQIIASAQEKDYGDVHDLGDTAFTVVDRDGGALPNGETVNTVTLVSENGIDGSTDADVGTYADNILVTPTSTNDPTITGSANFNQENYTFSYGTADLTVNRRAITLTANEQEKTYGDQLALDDTVFTTLDKDGDAALPNGEVVTNVTINSATGVDASTTSDVSTYADEIEISGPVAGTDGTGDGFLESNYDITYVAGDLNVNRRAAQIIASAQEKDYGDVYDLGDTAFTVVDRDGGALPNGETVNTVTLVSENGIRCLD